MTELKRILIIACCVSLVSGSLFSQEEDSSGTAPSRGGPSEGFQADTTVQHELSPLDITQDRGIFIVTPDGKMQLRIVGSVRFSVLYDFIEFSVKKSFNTYFIPTGDANVRLANYSNSLNMSRIGFEVTRKLATMDVFVRLETDFNGANGQLRIRHAYGQTAHFLVGQTWSLFSNVSSLPTMVDPNGPTGSVTIRTPQVRYGHHNKRGTTWAVALEYSQADLSRQEFDTTGVSTVQLFPDVTGRIVRQGMFGLVQLSGVFTTISKKGANDRISNTFGYGGSLSGTLNMPGNHAILYQVTYGKAISRFITTFKGTGKDAVFNPETKDFEGLDSFGGFLSYGIDWSETLSSHVSAGYARLFNKDFQPDDVYRESMSVSLDGFWDAVEGARLGLEFVWGKRWDENGATGTASRIWALFYYDF